jgi:hypothetical protein
MMIIIIIIIMTVKVEHTMKYFTNLFSLIYSLC